MELISTHIPKTAGTSFKSTLQDIYKKSLLLHYRQRSEIGPEIRAIHGHFGTRYYRKMFPEAKTVIWLRDPVDRAISHYYFWQSVKPRRNGNPVHEIVIKNGLSIVEFAKLPSIQNLMTKRFTTGVPIEDYDFVGLVEHYEEDVAALASVLGWPRVKTYRERVTKKRPYDIPPEIRAQLSYLNQQDVLLYERAKLVRESRLARDAHSSRPVLANPRRAALSA